MIQVFQEICRSVEFFLSNFLVVGGIPSLWAIWLRCFCLEGFPQTATAFGPKKGLPNSLASCNIFSDYPPIILARHQHFTNRTNHNHNHTAISSAPSTSHKHIKKHPKFASHQQSRGFILHTPNIRKCESGQFGGKCMSRFLCDNRLILCRLGPNLQEEMKRKQFPVRKLCDFF